MIEDVDAGAGLAVGDCLGRYTILRRLGAGGMGEIFSARDPELDRLVAVKVLRPGFGGTSLEARTRFHREAQAMARLNHPNVVSVFDVGTVGDRFFVAMELVEGPTLAAWLAEKPHPWREVVAVFLEAGRGLEAAHAAGIVHRDFKPSNVILGDRVRVADFGLARAPSEAPVDDSVPGGAAPTVLVGTVTATGAAVGTPAYMAPEQRVRGVVTAQSDQYSFCVALAEALAAGRTPRFVQALVARGLSLDPADRYPSMRALLADLGRDRIRTRRRWLLAGAGVAAVVLAAAIARRNPPPPLCVGIRARLAGIWDGPRRDAVRDAFAAPQLSYSHEAWRNVSHELDDYAARWVDMATETCRATRIEGSQSDALMDLRMACLERRRSVLGALTDLWSRGVDADMLAHATEAAGRLSPLADCADARALTERAPMPTDPALTVPIAVARSHVDVVQALTLAHRLPEAKKAVAQLRVEANASGWVQLQAEAVLQAGEVAYLLQDPDAEAELLEAARLGGAARDDGLAARALVDLVDHLARNAQTGTRALLVADIAAAWIARAGSNDALRARLLRNRAAALQTNGKYDAARALFLTARAYFAAANGADARETLVTASMLATDVRRAGDQAEARRLDEENLAVATALMGAEHPLVANILINLGNTALSADPEAAVGYYERALAIREKESGPDSAAVATCLSNLGAAELGLGHLERARALTERSVAIRERVFGSDHPFVGTSLTNLGEIVWKQGHPREARALQERTLAIWTKAYGPKHDFVAEPLVSIGEILESEGDSAGALDYYRRALAIRREALGPEHDLTLSSMAYVAQALELLHRCPEARPLIATAAAGVEKPAGADALADVLRVGAACDLDEGRPAAAAARLERALAIREKAKAEPVKCGSMRWLLARARWALGQRDQAIVAARHAEEELAADASAARDRVAVHSWLATHAR